MKRPALKFYGAKWNLGPWIISHFPPHDNYIEPCGGSAAVLLQKQPSTLEVFNDLDSNVTNFFRILRDRPDELIEKIRLTPYAREEFEYCRQPSDNKLENARRFFVGCWMSISNQPFNKSTGWRSLSNIKQRAIPHAVDFRVSIENLYNLADRFKYVQLENKPAEYVIQRYDNEDSLIYFDPPYVKETRSQKNQYNLEVDNQFHIDCAELLRQCKGSVIVSGYNCELYEQLYGDWRLLVKGFNISDYNKERESKYKKFVDNRVYFNSDILNEFVPAYDAPVEVLWRLFEKHVLSNAKGENNIYGYSLSCVKGWLNLNIRPNEHKDQQQYDIDGLEQVLSKLASYNYLTWQRAGNTWWIEIHADKCYPET